MDTLSHVCKWELWRVICGILKDINRYDKSSICIPGPLLLDGRNSITIVFFYLFIDFCCCAIDPLTVKSKLLFLIRYQSVWRLAFAFQDYFLWMILRFYRGRFFCMYRFYCLAEMLMVQLNFLCIVVYNRYLHLDTSAFK